VPGGDAAPAAFLVVEEKTHGLIRETGEDAALKTRLLSHQIKNTKSVANTNQVIVLSKQAAPPKPNLLHAIEPFRVFLIPPFQVNLGTEKPR
jgi:hypothetical protein